MRVHQTELKLTLMGLRGDILVLLLVKVFSVGVWGSLLVFSLCFLKFRLLWLLSFIELYMLKMGALMYQIHMKPEAVLLFGFGFGFSLSCLESLLRSVLEVYTKLD